MTDDDKELIALLRSLDRYEYADRIEALTEQLAAARQDAEEAEAYAEELENRLSICERHRDAYAECDRIGTQAVRDLEAKLAECEARLRKVVGALEKIAAEAIVTVHTHNKGGINYTRLYEDWRKLAVKRIDIARAALTETATTEERK